MDFSQLSARNLLQDLLSESAARHDHLCPRQVLGVRLGLFALEFLGLIEVAEGVRFCNPEKRLLTIAETDGCGVDGIAVAVDCAVGRRTLRVVDFGKVAATFVDLETGRAIRVSPRPDVRETAVCQVPDAESRWHAYLLGYQKMSDEAMFQVQVVELRDSIEAIISSPNMRVVCEQCGEEVFNEREVERDGRLLCRPCAGIDRYLR